MKHRITQKFAVLAISASMVLAPTPRACAYDVWDGFISAVVGGLSGGLAGYFGGRSAGRDAADDVKDDLEDDIEELEEELDDLEDRVEANEALDVVQNGRLDALEAQDIVLQDNIDAEAAAREAADTVLQDNIDTETAARIANDNLLQGNIDAEAAARVAGDAANAAAVAAETAARIADDNLLQANITAEAAARAAADTAINNELDIVQDELDNFFGSNLLGNGVRGTANPAPSLVGITDDNTTNDDEAYLEFVAPNGLHVGPMLVRKVGGSLFFDSDFALLLPAVAGTWTARIFGGNPAANVAVFEITLNLQNTTPTSVNLTLATGPGDDEMTFVVAADATL